MYTAIHSPISDAETIARLRSQATIINSPLLPDSLIDTTEVSLLTGISVATLASQRSRKTSRIPHLKIGGNVRYRLSDVMNYLTSTFVPAARP